MVALSLALPSPGNAADEATWTRYLDAGTAAYRKRDPDEATRQFEFALKEAEGFGEEDPRLATTLAWLAELYRVQRRFEESEKLIRRTIAMDEKYRGMEHPDLAMSLESLALLYHTQNRQREMEPVLKRVISIYEKALGPQHVRVASALNNLAALYRATGRLEEAEPLVSRALAIREKSLGMDHPDTVQSRNYLSLLHRDLARARPSRQRQVDLLRRPQPTAPVEVPPLQSPPAPAAPVAASPAPVASAPIAQAKPVEQVAPPAQSALPAQAQAAAPAPAPVPAPVQPSKPTQPLGALRAPGQQATVPVQPVAPQKPAVVPQVALAQPAPSKPAPVAAKPPPVQTAPAKPAPVPSTATPVVKPAAVSAQAALAVAAVPAPAPAPAVPRRLYRSSLAMELGFLGASSSRSSPTVVARAFDLMQLARNRLETGAVSRIAARFGRTDASLAQLASAREDLLDRWHGLDNTLVDAAGGAGVQRASPEIDRLRGEIAAVDRQISQQDALIEQRIPGYRDYLNPDSLQLASAQSLLGADEALLSYLVDDNASYLVVVRHDRFALFNLDIGRDELASIVKRLREELDHPSGDDAKRVVLRSYPVAQANQLYRRILGAAEPALAGASHLIIVPDESLNGLPFAALVTEPYPAPIKEPEEHAKVAWLGRRFALSMLPAEGTLRTLRRVATKPAARKPFAGFGDPVLGGEERGVRSGGSSGAYSRDALANVNQVWSFAPLPETRYALYAMADILQADQADVHLQEQASEASVKRLDLSDFRVIAFATHGFMADDFKGLAESALVFTPPRRGSEQDDGLLTASEVAQLKLNADLVILTATSTAAADGTPDVEGVSGLARAFFHAGDRALLATHWAVPSDATLKLVTRTLRERNRGVGNAEALRRAMLPLMNGEDRLTYAHPSYWAPFMVVGEGRVPGESHAAAPAPAAQPQGPAAQEPSDSGGGGFGSLLKGIFGR